MNHEALRVIRDEHASLAAMLNALLQMVNRGLDPEGRGEHERYFDVMRAMLFYIDEFPETLHHPKETELLFPRVAKAAPETAEVIAQLDREVRRSEARRMISHREATQLDRQVNRLQDVYRTYARGGVTRTERSTLDRRLVQIKRQLAFSAHDANGRPGNDRWDRKGGNVRNNPR